MLRLLGNKKITKRKIRVKTKKRVLQTLRGHGLSTQDQGECQRPDVKRFSVVGVGGESVVFKDCRCSEHLHWSRTVLTAKQQFQQVGGLQNEGQEECGPLALLEKTKRFENNSCTPPVSECCKYKLDVLFKKKKKNFWNFQSSNWTKQNWWFLSLIHYFLWGDSSPRQECLVAITLPSASFWQVWKLWLCAIQNQDRREICRAREAKGTTNPDENMRDESCCSFRHVRGQTPLLIHCCWGQTLSRSLSLSGLCLKNKVPDNVFFRVAKSLVPCLWVYISAWGTSPPSHHLVQVEPVSENVLFCFQEPSLRWHYSHAKQTQQHLGHPSTAGATWHNHSGLNSHTLSLNKLSLTHTHTQTHKIPHRQEISRVSTVMSSHTTHTFIALHPCSHLDLSSSLRDPISCCSLAPPAPSAPPSPLHEPSGWCDVRFLWWAS